MDRRDGMNYAPKGVAKRVVAPGEFRIAAIGLDHGHIYGMCNGLIEAGAELVKVYDPDPEKVRRFVETYPGVKVAASEEEILEDPSIHLVASAKIPSERCDLGLRVMNHGKDYFADKPPFTTLEQLERARGGVAVAAPLSGQRAMRRDVLDAVGDLAGGFGVEVGLTIDAAQAGFRVMEVPVAMRHRETGRDVAGFLHRGRQLVHVARALARRAARRIAQRVANRTPLP